MSVRLERFMERTGVLPTTHVSLLEGSGYLQCTCVRVPYTATCIGEWAGGYDCVDCADRLLVGRCFRGFVLQLLEYSSAVWCSAADTHLKLQERVVSGACLLLLLLLLLLLKKIGNARPGEGD